MQYITCAFEEYTLIDFDIFGLVQPSPQSIPEYFHHSPSLAISPIYSNTFSLWHLPFSLGLYTFAHSEHFTQMGNP
jgi:hypothetical protein